MEKCASASVLSQMSQFTFDRIKTKEFLQASSDILSLIRKFGKVFSPVINDMSANIQKLNAKYEEDINEHRFLKYMVTKDLDLGDESALTALLWLNRTLHFLSTFFELVIEDTLTACPSNDLTLYLKKAYSATLEEYHGWLGTQLFNVLSRFAPTRRCLMSTLSIEKDSNEEAVIKDLDKYNQKLAACIRKVSKILESNLFT